MSTVTIKNGGFEQAILQMVKEYQPLNQKDSLRLEHLKSLPQNRIEGKTMHSFNRKLQTFSRQAVTRNNVKVAHKMFSIEIVKTRIILERLKSF